MTIIQLNHDFQKTPTKMSYSVIIGHIPNKLYQESLDDIKILYFRITVQP